MGFFTKPATGQPGAAAGLAPLTAQRITDHLDRNGQHYRVDDDGDIGGMWDGHVYYFFRLGESQEILQVRGRWNRHVGLEEHDALLRLANAWNTDRLWPKVYVRVEGDELGVYGEHVVDYEPGLTDEQVDQHVACAITTTGAFFDHLDEAYPEQAAAARAEDDQD